MNKAVCNEHLCVVFQEYGRGQTLLGTAGFELRIGECNPNFRNFALGKKRVDKLNSSTNKTDIREVFLCSGLGTTPHTSTLDIYSDKVFIGVATAQRYGIFATTTTEFEHNRIIILEEILMPATFQRVVFVENLLKFGLYQIFEGEILGESQSFAFSHYSLLCSFVFKPTAHTPLVVVVGAKVIL